MFSTRNIAHGILVLVMVVAIGALVTRERTDVVNNGTSLPVVGATYAGTTVLPDKEVLEFLGLSVNEVSDDVLETSRFVREILVYNQCTGEIYVQGSAVVSGDRVFTVKHVIRSHVYMLINDPGCSELLLLYPTHADTVRLTIDTYKYLQDIALLRIPTQLKTERVCFSEDYQEGDPVYLVGYAGESSTSWFGTVYWSRKVIMPNTIKALPEEPTLYWVVTVGAIVKKGMSGGALIDSSGCVLGLISLGIDDELQNVFVSASVAVKGFREWIE